MVGKQLGTGYSSNDSGDGPIGGTSRCVGCNITLDGQLKMCGNCYEKGTEYPSDHCSVCHVLVGSDESKRVKIPVEKWDPSTSTSSRVRREPKRSGHDSHRFATSEGAP